MAHFRLDETVDVDARPSDSTSSAGASRWTGLPGAAGDPFPASVPRPAVPAAAAEPLALLAAAPECLRLRFARSTDVAGRFVLVAEFASAALYRRSLSPWPMRTVVVPWLSTADVDTSEVHEVLLAAEHGLPTSSEPTVTPPGR